MSMSVGAAGDDEAWDEQLDLVAQGSLARPSTAQEVADATAKYTPPLGWKQPVGTGDIDFEQDRRGRFYRTQSWTAPMSSITNSCKVRGWGLPTEGRLPTFGGVDVRNVGTLPLQNSSAEELSKGIYVVQTRHMTMPCKMMASFSSGIPLSWFQVYNHAVVVDGREVYETLRTHHLRPNEVATVTEFVPEVQVVVDESGLPGSRPFPFSAPELMVISARQQTKASNCKGRNALEFLNEISQLIISKARQHKSPGRELLANRRSSLLQMDVPNFENTSKPWYPERGVMSMPIHKALFMKCRRDLFSRDDKVVFANVVEDAVENGTFCFREAPPNLLEKDELSSIEKEILEVMGMARMKGEKATSQSFKGLMKLMDAMEGAPILQSLIVSTYLNEEGSGPNGEVFLALEELAAVKGFISLHGDHLRSIAFLFLLKYHRYHAMNNGGRVITKEKLADIPSKVSPIATVIDQLFRYPNGAAAPCEQAAMPQNLVANLAGYNMHCHVSELGYGETGKEAFIARDLVKVLGKNGMEGLICGTLDEWVNVMEQDSVAAGQAHALAMTSTLKGLAEEGNLFASRWWHYATGVPLPTGVGRRIVNVEDILPSTCLELDKARQAKKAQRTGRPKKVLQSAVKASGGPGPLHPDRVETPAEKRVREELEKASNKEYAERRARERGAKKILRGDGSGKVGLGERALAKRLRSGGPVLLDDDDESADDDDCAVSASQRKGPGLMTGLGVGLDAEESASGSEKLAMDPQAALADLRQRKRRRKARRTESSEEMSSKSSDGKQDDDGSMSKENDSACEGGRSSMGDKEEAPLSIGKAASGKDEEEKKESSDTDENMKDVSEDNEGTGEGSPGNAATADAGAGEANVGDPSFNGSADCEGKASTEEGENEEEHDSGARNSPSITAVPGTDRLSEDAGCDDAATESIAAPDREDAPMPIEDADSGKGEEEKKESSDTAENMKDVSVDNEVIAEGLPGNAAAAIEGTVEGRSGDPSNSGCASEKGEASMEEEEMEDEHESGARKSQSNMAEPDTDRLKSMKEDVGSEKKKEEAGCDNAATDTAAAPGLATSGTQAAGRSEEGDRAEEPTKGNMNAELGSAAGESSMPKPGNEKDLLQAHESTGTSSAPVPVEGENLRVVTGDRKDVSERSGDDEEEKRDETREDRGVAADDNATSREPSGNSKHDDRTDTSSAPAAMRGDKSRSMTGDKKGVAEIYAGEEATKSAEATGSSVINSVAEVTEVEQRKEEVRDVIRKMQLLSEKEQLKGIDREEIKLRNDWLSSIGQGVFVMHDISSSPVINAYFGDGEKSRHVRTSENVFYGQIAHAWATEKYNLANVTAKWPLAEGVHPFLCETGHAALLRLYHLPLIAAVVVRNYLEVHSFRDYLKELLGYEAMANEESFAEGMKSYGMPGKKKLLELYLAWLLLYRGFDKPGTAGTFGSTEAPRYVHLFGDEYTKDAKYDVKMWESRGEMEKVLDCATTSFLTLLFPKNRDGDDAEVILDVPEHLCAAANKYAERRFDEGLGLKGKKRKGSYAIWPRKLRVRDGKVFVKAVDIVRCRSGECIDVGAKYCLGSTEICLLELDVNRPGLWNTPGADDWDLEEPLCFEFVKLLSGLSTVECSEANGMKMGLSLLTQKGFERLGADEEEMQAVDTGRSKIGYLELSAMAGSLSRLRKAYKSELGKKMFKKPKVDTKHGLSVVLPLKLVGGKCALHGLVCNNEKKTTDMRVFDVLIIPGKQNKSPVRVFPKVSARHLTDDHFDEDEHGKKVVKNGLVPMPAVLPVIHKPYDHTVPGQFCPTPWLELVQIAQDKYYQVRPGGSVIKPKAGEDVVVKKRLPWELAMQLAGPRFRWELVAKTD